MRLLTAIVLTVLATKSVIAEPRIAVLSAFQPEWERLRAELEGPERHPLPGREAWTGTLAGQPVVLALTGISMVNAAMTTQMVLERFEVDTIVVSGIAGGVDPDLAIGDVVVAGQWGQYLDVVAARPSADGFLIPPFLEVVADPFGTLHPRAQDVVNPATGEPETRFWFEADADLLVAAAALPGQVDLAACTGPSECLEDPPEIVVGGNGVSGAAFVDNAEMRSWAHETFAARVLDMETAAIAHVAYVNDVPFIAFRSLSDLAGGSEDANELPIFFSLAAENAAQVVLAYLSALSGEDGG